jgi:manganese/zinc/iron transport system permease protein
MTVAGLSHNTLVVAAGVSAVGFAAGVVGSLCVLRKRALVGDAAAHATLVGVALAFLATGRRDLPALLVGGFASALAGLGTLVLIRRFTRTRDDAATAIVIGVGFGAGIALVSGIPAWGYPDSAGLETFLLGHTAALTARDAAVLAAVAGLALVVVVATLKESTLVAFDAAFAAASGWPVTAIDCLIVGLVAAMVVAGLPAVGAVLVTALVVIPPVTARAWTDRVPTMLALAGLIGVAAALVGVAVSASWPGLATGPLVVIAAAACFAVSFLAAPGRGWIARRLEAATVAREWDRGLAVDACRRLAGGDEAGAFTVADVLEATCGERIGGRRPARTAWETLVRTGLVAPAAGTAGRWRLTAEGAAEADRRSRGVEAWLRLFDQDPDEARAMATFDRINRPPERSGHDA